MKILENWKVKAIDIKCHKDKRRLSLFGEKKNFNGDIADDDINLDQANNENLFSIN